MATAVHASDAHWAQLGTKWDKRSKIAGDWLKGERKVVDIGCGLMGLRDHLDSKVHYIGVDCVARDSTTIVIDLNRNFLPIIDSEVAVLLGVIEYIENPADFLVQLRVFRRVILSYNHFGLQDIFWALRLRTKSVHWVHRHSPRTFRRMLRDAGFVIVRRARVRLGECLYELRPAPAAQTVRPHREKAMVK